LSGFGFILTIIINVLAYYSNTLLHRGLYYLYIHDIILTMRNFNAEPKTVVPWLATAVLGGLALHLAGKNRVAEQQVRTAEKAEAHIMHQATHDELTGLLNRRGLENLLAGNKPPRAILYADSTNLKAVNDKLSHDRGDQAITATADILKASLRPGDIAARTGGDEFLVLLDAERRESQDNLSPDELLAPVTSRIQKATQNLLELPENADLVSTGFDLAVGGAVWEQGMSIDDLRGAAEQAMYAAKTVQHQTNGQHR
jgi:diguanylate cyclase (GGDEF)-like protein